MAKRHLFPSNSTYKPLAASLFRLGIAKYVSDRAFGYLVIEQNVDEEWNECIAEFQLDLNSNPSVYEAAFFKFVDEALFNQDEIILKLIVDFFRWSPKEMDYKEVYGCLKDLDVDETLLKQFATSVRKLNEAKEKRDQPFPEKVSRNSDKVFVIHGHDPTARLELEKLLRNEFKLEPVILQDMPGANMETIIAKFEREANKCATAIALFTPDDELESGESHPRLNVILELGYFMGRDQGIDRRLLILKKANSKGPSDINGVETLNFEKSIDEIESKLRKVLKLWKVIV